MFVIDASYSGSLQTIAACLRVHLGWLDKLQGKAVTHFCEVEWWINFDGGMCNRFLTI